jgi:two-component system chemotaxis response regulator CheY
MAKVLIVDDSLIMRSILSSMVVKAGHEVIGEASGGTEAFRMYRELNPDMVTLDIQMEEGDGLTCLKDILRLDPEAKVVMVTARGDPQMETRARSLGAIGYVSKPFRYENILEEIQNALA